MYSLGNLFLLSTCDLAPDFRDCSVYREMDACSIQDFSGLVKLNKKSMCVSVCVYVYT